MSDETRPDLPAEQTAQPDSPPPAESAPEAAPAPEAPPMAEPPAWEAPQAPPTPEPTGPAPYAPPVYTPQPQPSRGGVSGATVALAVVAALVMGAIAGVAGGILGGRMVGGMPGPSAANRRVTVVPSTTDEPVIAAAAAAVPSIVNIDVASGEKAGGESGLPNTHPSVPMRGNGSGVAFKKVANGGTYILTNNHVVDEATRLTVTDSSGETFAGTLVGRDPDTDIAVVRIAEDLPTIEVGDSTQLLVGQLVVAIGSPFGFEHSVTSGVVSALGRSLRGASDGTGATYPLADIIQTDAAINPGNSGGALVDKSGRLVGINTAIYSGTGQSGGIGFAIPVGTAVRVADELISGGKVGHPFIGLVGSTLDAETAAEKKLSVDQGALVGSLTKGAGAEKGGVKVGDVVTAVDSTDIRSMDDLIIQIRRRAIGDTVKLTVRRGDQTLTLDVVVGDKPADFKMPSVDSSPTTPGK